ncbi:amidohydrolase family protein [Actinopolymorpha alba]|uniref:amidohydrolase family protein n=1 Tax=Actinopolymorpha alba TaxID=533267 RepID=UPI0003780319|nr:amidohydrolase family protein [Actinopolymorpha alba]
MHAFGPVIDAHQHFWDPSTGGYPWLAREPESIQRAFDYADLAPHLAAYGIDGTVLVQSADSDEDTDAMFAQAAAHPEILGVVGYVPLEQPARAERRLQELLGRERFVGIRNLIHDQPDPDWLLRADVAEGLALLEAHQVPFDLVAVLPRHLEHVAYLSEQFPNLTVVIDHLAKPPIGTPRSEPWTSLLRDAADNPRVVAKVSGLYAATGDPAAFTADDLAPWIASALEFFGPSRLMVGSDWPVAVVAGGYDRVMGAVIEVVTAYGPEVAGPLLGGTAIATYGLTLSVTA